MVNREVKTGAGRNDAATAELEIRGAVWTPSNALSVLRMLLVVPAALCYTASFPYHREAAVLVVLLAMLTDTLDGYIARARHEVSELGKIIDPLADKVGIGVLLLVMAAAGDVRLWYVAAVVGRDLLILLGGVVIRKKKKRVLPSMLPGKIAVVLIAITLVVAMLGNPELDSLGAFTLWASVVMMAASLAVYAVRFAGVLRQEGENA